MDESIEITSLGNKLSICLFFGEFELGYAYKLYAYIKKRVYSFEKGNSCRKTTSNDSLNA